MPTTAKFTSSLFSSTGYDNTLTINFTKQVPTNPEGISWNMSASITDRQGNPLSRANGVISFNGDGALIGNTLGELMNGNTPLNIDFGSFFDPTKPNSGFDGVIIGEKSALSDISKNGYADGVLKSYAISGAGSVVAQFSNGVQATVAKIPVFHFQNDQGLYTEGGVFFSQTLNSGEAFMYVDKNGNPYNGTEIIKLYIICDAACDPFRAAASGTGERAGKAASSGGNGKARQTDSPSADKPE